MPVGKTLGAIAIDIDAAKPFAVVIIDGYLPMTMFAAAIAVQTAGLLTFSLFHSGILGFPNYRNFDRRAQVPTWGLTLEYRDVLGQARSGLFTDSRRTGLKKTRSRWNIRFTSRVIENERVRRMGKCCTGKKYKSRT